MKNKNPFKFKPIAVTLLALIFVSCKPENDAKTNSKSVDQANSSIAEKKDTPVKFEDKRTEMHHRLDSLIGEWNVEKTNTIVPGFSAEKPLVSRGTITCKREWMEKAGYLFIKDETMGKFGDFDYYRLGVLGYSIPDDRFEWNTADNFNSVMMTYKGAKGSGKSDKEISISGEYTDAGLLGEQYKGKIINQRTVFKIESNERQAIELYFTPPGEKERLVDTMIYTRRR